MWLISNNQIGGLVAEVDQKGGLDNPTEKGGNAELELERKMAIPFITNPVRMDKDNDFDQQRLSLAQFVPRGGFLPVELLNRA